ncbi:MAG: zinc ribbon domain-containing protein [Candidatus Hermodarchaeota archaeon]
MKIQKLHNSLTVVMMVLILFSMSPLFYCDSDDYEIDVDENSKVVWKVSDVDEDKLDYLLSVSDVDVDEFDYEEDDKITFEINSIDEISDEYYIIRYDYYENDEELGTRAEYIAMDPEDLADDLEDLALEEYSTMFVLTDTRDYLDEFGDEVADIYKNIIYNAGSSIIINSTIGTFLFWLEMEYDDRVILEELSLVYDVQEIFKMEQKNYSRLPEFPIFLVLIIIIIIVIVVLLGVVGLIVFFNKNAKKNRKIITPIPTESPDKTEELSLVKSKEDSKTESEREPVKTLYCPNCGTEKEKDAVFCTYCGTKF